MSTKTLVIAVSSLIVGAAAYKSYAVWQDGRSGKEKSHTANPPQARVEKAEVNKAQALKDLVERWGKSSHDKAMLLSLCEEAVTKLGAGDELVQFVNYLTSIKANEQREWLLGTGLRKLFSGPNAKAAREQMLTVADTGIRNTLCQRAGEGFGALRFKEYLDSLAASHPDCQSPLLAGRCMAVAKVSLEGAVYAFRELKTKNINHVCLGEALAVALEKSDYASAKASLNALPDDLKFEAVTGLRGKQGKNVGPYLAAIDEVLPTGEWAKNEKNLCMKLHNLVLYTPEIDTLLAWSLLLPERTDTEDLFRVAIRPFVTRYPEKAKPWILALPPGWKRENALTGFVQAALSARGDVAGAQWGRGQIKDPRFANTVDGWILEFETRTGKPFPR